MPWRRKGKDQSGASMCSGRPAALTRVRAQAQHLLISSRADSLRCAGVCVCVGVDWGDLLHTDTQGPRLMEALPSGPCGFQGHPGHWP